jgi:hypothetical protein
MLTLPLLLRRKRAPIRIHEKDRYGLDMESSKKRIEKAKPITSTPMCQIDHLRDEKEGKAWAFGDELWTD